jgi:N-glycosylase/DNA lyase
VRIKFDDFDLVSTLESGQVFGFEKIAQGRYAGVLLGHPVKISQRKGFLNVENGKTGLSPDTVRHFFDLDRDLTEIYSVLREDSALAPSFKAFKGLRLIRQEPWEALACFIISSNNNVKRIQGIYKNLVGYFSCRGAARRAPPFPEPIQIAKTHERILRQLGLGYRAPFLWSTAVFLSHNPEYLETIRDLDYEEAKDRVISFPGIGPKVADCALLYGFHRLDAFPVDVWVLRAMRKLYFRNRGVSEAKVHAFGRKRWGSHAGYVQQYLFHSARAGILFSL